MRTIASYENLPELPVRKDYDKELEEIHKFSRHNKNMLEQSILCYCFHCKRKYEPKLIVEWCDEGVTAICPFCYIDSIIPSHIPSKTNVFITEFINRMYDYWFVQGTVTLQFKNETIDN